MMKARTTFLASVLTILAAGSCQNRSEPYNPDMALESISIANTHGNCPTLPAITGDSVKNIILVVIDGGGFNHILATRYRYYGIGGRLNLERFPYIAVANTHSADTAIITDSGAAGTALATGYKTINGMIGMTPDHLTRENLMEHMYKLGKATAVITYGSLNGATPAAFTSHVSSRNEKAAITRQLLGAGASFLFGDAIDLMGEGVGMEKLDTLSLNKLGYQRFINRLPDKALRSGEKTLILYDSLVQENASLHGREVVSRPGAPSLKTVVQTALPVLKDNPKGFFMLLEEDWVDSWGHANRGDLLTQHLKQLDDALEPLIRFAQSERNTLILVTSDHETGGLTIPLIEGGGTSFRVGFSTEEHTPALVPIFQYGPANLSYLNGVIENTAIHKYILRVAR